MFKTQAPASTEALEPGRSVPQDADELGPCAGRPMPEGCSGLLVYNGRENPRGFQYVHLGYEEFSADGLWFVVEFNVAVGEKWRVTVRGRRLEPVFISVHNLKQPWIRKADREFDDGGPLITAITIEPVEEGEGPSGRDGEPGRPQHDYPGVITASQKSCTRRAGPE